MNNEVRMWICITLANACGLAGAPIAIGWFAAALFYGWLVWRDNKATEA